jgi:hypothetical protein
MKAPFFWRRISVMSRYGGQYSIARPTGVCAATGRPLEPGTSCIATLCEHPEDEGFDRLDFSIEAWESGERPAHLFSYWKTIVPSPDAKPNPLVDDAVLMDLFERLAEDDRPQRIAFRFVLGLILMRKRLLKFAGRTGEGEHEQWLLRPKGADADTPPLRVTNPHLNDDDVRELTAQLSEILQGEL